MKKLLISAALLALSSTTAYAACDGLYAGGQLGYGDQGYDVHHAFIPFGSLGSSATDVSHYSSSDVDASGFAQRLFAGYQFNANLAAEMGYTHLADSQTKGSINTPLLTTSLNNTIKEQAVDVVGKLMYPVTNTGITVYTKLGAAWVDADQETHMNVNSPLIGRQVIMDVSTSTDPLRPVFGAGASYDLTQNLSFDASWTRIEGNNLVQNIDFYGAGLTYHFA